VTDAIVPGVVGIPGWGHGVDGDLSVAAVRPGVTATSSPTATSSILSGNAVLNGIPVRVGLPRLPLRPESLFHPLP
jgi:hypothetical protein